MKQINFIGSSNLSAPVKYMINIDEANKRITTVGLLDVTDSREADILPDADVEPWATHETAVTAHSASMYYNRNDFGADSLQQFFNNVPDHDAADVFRIAWKCTLDIDTLGADEWCDYTMLNVTTRNGGATFVGVRARLAESRIYKGDGARYRAHGDYKHAVCLYVPFAKADFANVTMDILAVWEYPPHIINDTADTSVNENINPPTGHVWNTRFWRVEQTSAATVAAGGFVDIPLHLEWTVDDTACSEITTLKIEPVNGYATSARVTTAANGQAVCRVGALGLVAGDVVKMKVNSHLMQNLGVLTATVT